ALGLWVIYRDYLGVILHSAVRLGAARAAFIIPFLLGLLLWVEILRRLQFSTFVQWSGVLLGLTHIGFNATHEIRPGGLAFVIVMFKLAWLLLRGERVWGGIAGLLAGLGFGVHTSMVIFWFSLPLLALWMDGSDAFRSSRYRWWLIGLLGGFI